MPFVPPRSRSPAETRLVRVALAACMFVCLLTLSPVSAQQQDLRPVYRIGVLTDNYPYSFLDKDDPRGQPRGYVVDLLAAIEPRLGFRLERVVGPTSEINPAFEAGTLDLLQSYVPNDERRKFAAFSHAYLQQNGAVFAREGTRGIHSLDDLRGRRVMVHPGSLGERILRERGLAASIVLVDSVEEGFRQLEAGLNDATLASRLTGYATIRHLELKRIVAVGRSIEGYDSSYCFAARGDHKSLAGELTEALAALDAAEKERIYNRWFDFVPPEGYSGQDIAKAVSAGLTLALLVAIWALLHQRRLRKQIARQAAELRESEAQYRTVFESTLHGMIVFEKAAESENRWVILQLNPTAHRILGAPATASERPTFAEAFPTEGTLAHRLEGALSSPHPEPFEHDRSRDGIEAWVDVAVSRMGDYRRLVAIRDITESRIAAERLRQSETQLRQNQKLEAIGTLASGIAHDFNNVLTAILGNTELMRLDLQADHVATPALQEISQAAERARFLVRQILTFSRKSEARREMVEVAHIVKETLRFVSATAPSTIEFQHHAEEQLPEIEIDPTQLHQVLMNLCTNAVHALRDRSGVIELSEYVAYVGPGSDAHPAHLRPGRYLVLNVRDNGAGMPPEVLQRLFEPFFTTKPSGEGTGLGLAVVHGIVTSCHGAITVSSTPGQGTTFSLYFPAATRSAATQTRAETPAPPGHGERILLVDDEPAIVQAAKRLLERLGYEVVAFSRPVDALAEFRHCNGAFDVVVTDLTMPKMSGIDLAGCLRAITPGLPVILMSGFINDREMALARAARITRTLEKPLTLASLGEAIASCLPRQSSPPGAAGAHPDPSTTRDQANIRRP